jgi:hypothetical protein
MLVAQVHPGAVIAFLASVIGGGLVVSLLAGWLVVRSARPSYGWKQLLLAMLGALIGGSLVAAAVAPLVDARHYEEEVAFGAAVAGFVLGAPFGAWVFAVPPGDTMRAIQGLFRPPQVVLTAYFLLATGYLLYETWRPKTVDELLVQMTLPDRPFQGYQDRQRFSIRQQARRELMRRGTEAVPRLTELVRSNQQYSSFPTAAALSLICEFETPEGAAFLVKFARQASRKAPVPQPSHHEIVLRCLETLGPRVRQAIPLLLAEIEAPASSFPAPAARNQQAAFWALLEIDPTLIDHPSLVKFVETYQTQAESGQSIARKHARQFLDELAQFQGKQSDKP